ncbi:NrfD/PsrC family molybdoenzyme membrane anchor subunit [Conexibacter sp. DBS9H8]|uniref:NrfD/PsrC family molybdoenzyme membrane anchor subunit n=1 Tax=Conexibacter sp. DBS9H8 TaxID=2937801 RepID=UPI0020100773|nr:NrfD/PsrC family molybdoenzyme membrane anchor subunit [Conexibacter sp. DBS9H8]
MSEPQGSHGVGQTGRQDQGQGDRSYYGRPVLNPPVWEEREIAGYLFTGGLAGASSILAAAADAGGAAGLVRPARLCASAAISVSFVALIKDLGRPERFLNMLRVFKPTSPMSVGTWILSAYAPLNFAASASTLTGRAPRAGAVAGAGAGLLGSAVATYTAVLVADTAVPTWHEAHRELPFLFAGSAASAAGGFGLLAAARAENGPARTMAVLGAVGELAAMRTLRQRLGPLAETLDTGPAGRRLRAAERLSVAGVIGAALLGRRSRVAAALAGGALMSASALTRFGIFAAGMASAEDPHWTVDLQRARIAAAATAAQPSPAPNPASPAPVRSA